MEATKYTFKVEAEALSKDSIPGLIADAINKFVFEECAQGSLVHDDGDSVSWSTEKEEVEF